MNYYLRETEWPSFRKRILQDLLIILVFFFFFCSDSQPHFLVFLPLAARRGQWVWYCSSPLGCSFALPTVLPRSAPQGTDAVRDPATICPALSYPQIAKLFEASGIALPTPPCASTPLSTQSHTSSTSMSSFPSRCLELALFSSPFSTLLVIFSAYHGFGTPLTSQQGCLLCLDMCLGPYQPWNPFPLLQTALKNRRLVSSVSQGCWGLLCDRCTTGKQKDAIVAPKTF